MDTEKEIKEIKEELERLKGILFGINNDERYKAKVRKIVIDDRTSAGLPIIADTNGRLYTVNDVTEL